MSRNFEEVSVFSFVMFRSQTLGCTSFRVLVVYLAGERGHSSFPEVRCTFFGLNTLLGCQCGEQFSSVRQLESSFGTHLVCVVLFMRFEDVHAMILGY